MFSAGKVLETEDHVAIGAVHSFLQNIYLYGCSDTEAFRAYLLAETLMVPHVVIPYLERCVYHAAVLTRRSQSNREALGDFAGFNDLPEVRCHRY